MNMQFDHIFTSEGVWARKPDRHAFIEQATLGVEQVSALERPRRGSGP